MLENLELKQVVIGLVVAFVAYNYYFKDKIAAAGGLKAYLQSLLGGGNTTKQYFPANDTKAAVVVAVKGVDAEPVKPDLVDLVSSWEEFRDKMVAAKVSPEAVKEMDSLFAALNTKKTS